MHSGTAVVDLSLPAALPFAELIPAIVESLGGRDIGAAPTRYQLCPLGAGRSRRQSLWRNAAFETAPSCR
ncbi:WXG100 secretion system (Wss), YukD family protein [Mycobacterium ulcerans str. Harvey]|uniref:WXG100 secretion system (Wss), YukD family protein n=1 Tax=Mycobacterium ulcerans str. Harvey TaxID=1299332 RepID=A0ABN0R4T4_MYCUL|nr:WXG100 secretion system (Wss), YukD family protein [Mycobacterium ulcerans str. Harvey]